MRHVMRSVERSVKTRGLLGTLIHSGLWLGMRARGRGAAPSRVEDDFDARHGVDTAGVIPQAQLDTVSPRWVHGSAYVPTDPVDLRGLLHRHRVHVEEATFVDLGCGKGRAVLLAAGLPFAAVVGVELSPTLADVARNNVRRFRGTISAGGVEIVTGDAATYRFPPTPLVVFLYHPFDEVVMRHVVHALERSLEAQPRRVVVLYVKPVHPEPWTDSPWFTNVEQDARIAVYDDAPRLTTVRADGRSVRRAPEPRGSRRPARAPDRGR